MSPFELLRQLNELDEHPRIEAKTGSEIGKAILETVCAFANEPGMGGEQRGKGSATYYVPTARFLATLSGQAPKPPLIEGAARAIQTPGEAVSILLEAIQVSEAPIQVSDLPDDLDRRIEELGKKPKPADFEAALLALCQWRPLSASDLARLLQRSRVYLVNNYLARMVADGWLEPTIPEKPKHPRQAYRAVEQGGNE